MQGKALEFMGGPEGSSLAESAASVAAKAAELFGMADFQRLAELHEHAKECSAHMKQHRLDAERMTLGEYLDAYTEEVIVIRDYLLRQIEWMKSTISKQRSNKIAYEGLYAELEATRSNYSEQAYKDKTYAIRKHATAILGEWVKQGYIIGHANYKEAAKQNRAIGLAGYFRFKFNENSLC